jgi:LuxR family maltose regulon positive regulatory protein
MQKADPLIRTKLRPPFTRLELVPRPRLQARIADGLCRPLTLVTAPAGFGKTTLVASSVADSGMPVAWLSLDKNDNEGERFLRYLIAALQQADDAIGSEAAQLLAAAQPVPPEAVLTNLINDLDAAGAEMALVLDDYQAIHNRAAHQAVAFLLEHCPATFHLVIATRSDPPLPLSRLRARGQTVELRLADLRFTESEAAQFLNEVMGLGLDAGSVVVLEERTEGWIAGLQMAALSMRDRADIAGFIAGFSGTNRFILDYLLEEVLANQSPEIQRFLLHTSILDRLTAPLCDYVLASVGESRGTGDERSTPGGLLSAGPSASMLEHLERANLFLTPLDDVRAWYRYHHLFADLLRAQLQRSLGSPGVAQLHIRAADWYAQHGSLLEAIHHASQAADQERVERLIEQHYMELVSHGEMARMQAWRGKLSKEQVHTRPWLCIYEAYSHAWFGELDEADHLLAVAEKRMRSEIPAADADSMQSHLDYVKSRVTAMRGDMQWAIALCLAARKSVPADNPALQFDTGVTLGYEYFLQGDYANATRILEEMIRSGVASGAVIHTVAASCMLARLYAVQGQLHRSHSTYQMAAQAIPEASQEHRDATALVEVGLADLLCEWDDLDGALVHLQRGLALLAWWAKVDDSALAYVTLARIHLAQGNERAAMEAVERAAELVRTRGVFSEARQAVEVAQVKLWLAQGDLEAAGRWAASRDGLSGASDRSRFEDELAQTTRARVWIAQNQAKQAAGLLSHLEEAARSAGRMGRVIEILILKALALQRTGDTQRGLLALTDCLTLAEPEGYARIFLDEGPPMQVLLAQWPARASAGPLRDYAIRLLRQFDAGAHVAAAVREKAPQAVDLPASPGPALTEPGIRRLEETLIEPLTQRELEVLQLVALGRTNREVAQELIVAPGTVKAHTASIYRKLDVANRTEAVARARQLGMLPS